MVVLCWLVMLIVRDGGRRVLASDDCEGRSLYGTGW